MARQVYLPSLTFRDSYDKERTLDTGLRFSMKGIKETSLLFWKQKKNNFLFFIEQ